MEIAFQILFLFIKKEKKENRGTNMYLGWVVMCVSACDLPLLEPQCPVSSVITFLVAGLYQNRFSELDTMNSATIHVRHSHGLRSS